MDEVALKILAYSNHSFNSSYYSSSIYLAFTPLPVDRFPNILASYVPINMLRNPPFYSFASFLIVWLTTFMNTSGSS